MRSKSAKERYDALVKDLQQQLSPFDAKDLSWIDMARKHRVGSQLLHILMQSGKITRMSWGRYQADPSLYDLTGDELRKMSAEYFKEKREQIF